LLEAGEGHTGAGKVQFAELQRRQARQMLQRLRRDPCFRIPAHLNDRRTGQSLVAADLATEVLERHHGALAIV
jgi:hypothetical protein